MMIDSFTVVAISSIVKAQPMRAGRQPRGGVVGEGAGQGRDGSGEQAAVFQHFQLRPRALPEG